MFLLSLSLSKFDMATNANFEYENETNINENLKCGICNDPFTNPIETPCHHTFCLLCINGWLNVSKSTCPTCRQLINKHNIKPINLRSFLSMLDQLRVKCLFCEQSNIERGNFPDHVAKQCSKVPTNCVPMWTEIPLEPLSPLVAPSAPLDESPSIFKRRDNPDRTITMYVDDEIPNISEETLAQATVELIVNTQCNEILLYSRPLSPTSLSRIASVLTNDRSVRSLDLSSCQIDNTGIEAFMNSFPINSCLRSLNLYVNLITDVGMESIVNMLQRNRSLTRLVLAHNRIGDKGIELLANLFYYHDVTLNVLCIGNNQFITDKSLSSIVTLVRWHRNLTLLKLDDIKLSYHVLKLIGLFYKLDFFSNLRLIL